MRAMDVLLAFPPILFLLVVATGAGSGIGALVVAIAIIHVPSVRASQTRLLVRRPMRKAPKTGSVLTSVYAGFRRVV